MYSIIKSLETQSNYKTQKNLVFFILVLSFGKKSKIIELDFSQNRIGEMIYEIQRYGH
jgi:hypothetical protein